MTNEANKARLDVVKRLQSAMTDLEWTDYQELILSLTKTLGEECKRISVQPPTEPQDELAHELAEFHSKVLITSDTATATDSHGNHWHDLNNIGSPELVGDDINDAVRYLEGAGILFRSPENSNWISWDEDEFDEDVPGLKEALRDGLANPE